MIKLDIKKKLLTSNGPVILDANLKIKKNDFICLYGESGSGKTTLLKIIAGLNKPDSGRIIMNDTIWYDSEKKINAVPQKRKIGYVFQDYALFPNLTVKKNISYSCKDKKKVDHLLKIIKLTQLADVYPNKLSGGQKQRVSLARAIASEPEILLLDEPFSSLDNGLKNELIQEVSRLHKLFKLTTIFVSHDLSEILILSKKILIINNNGKISSKEYNIESFLNYKTSNKFSFIGEIIKIKKVDIIYIILISIGSNIVEVIATEDEIKTMKPGKKVLIGSKAFNPMIKIL